MKICIDCSVKCRDIRCRRCHDKYRVGDKCSSFRHGLSKTRFYGIFQNLRNRCTRKDDENFANYGGRGIKCFWKSFKGFRDDMYESYQEHVKEFGVENTQIERIDNNGNYCKENCWWATRTEQIHNRSIGIHPILKNQTRKCLSDWAKELGVSRMTLYKRIHRGWSLEKTINQPIDRAKRNDRFKS